MSGLGELFKDKDAQAPVLCPRDSDYDLGRGSHLRIFEKLPSGF